MNKLDIAHLKEYSIDEVKSLMVKDTNTSQKDCQLFIGGNKQFPPKSHGDYFLRLNGTFYFIRIYKKPNFIKRFFMKSLLGVEFYETKERI